MSEGSPLRAVPRLRSSASVVDLCSHYVNRPPDVSVIIGSFQGAGTIGSTLRSLARQTLPYGRFEVLVVQNGPADHTAKIVEQVRDDHPGLKLRRMEYRAPGLGRARNAGMAMARGAYVTFVDDDDTVSPNYLRALLDNSDADIVGVAHLADVTGPDAAPDFDNRLADQLSLAGRTVSPGAAISALTYSVGKLLPTGAARSISFDPDLRSGEDIPFYLRFFMTYPMSVRFVPLDQHAVYYRTVVEGSLSRQSPSHDFNVMQRLDVIERLEVLRATEDWHHLAIRERTKSQTRAINRYLRLHPEQELRVRYEIQERGLTSIPIDLMTSGLHYPEASASPDRTAEPVRSEAPALSMAG